MTEMMGLPDTVIETVMRNMLHMFKVKHQLDEKGKRFFKSPFSLLGTLKNWRVGKGREREGPTLMEAETQLSPVTRESGNFLPFIVKSRPLPL